MINTMRANINLRPRTDVPYDIWCPMSLGIKPSTAFHINSVEKDCLELFESIPKSETIEIYNNGEPPAWAERIANILRKNGYNKVSIDPGRDIEYFNNPSTLFPDIRKPYKIYPIGDLREKIQTFFEFYKTQKWQIEEPRGDMLGHYHRGRMLWTQIQPMNDPNLSRNPELMNEMYKLIDPVRRMIKKMLKENSIVIKDLDKKITLRALEYVNVNNLNDKLNSHIDSSLLTGLLYHDAPSLHTLEFLDDSLTLQNSIKKDISDEIFNGNSFWIPGFVYADVMKSYVSPCWHGVQVPAKYPKRLSMVVRIEDDLMHKGKQTEIPGYYWDTISMAWLPNKN